MSRLEIHWKSAHWPQRDQPVTLHFVEISFQWKFWWWLHLCLVMLLFLDVVGKFISEPEVICSNIFSHRRETAVYWQMHSPLLSSQKEKGHRRWHDYITTARTGNIFFSKNIQMQADITSGLDSYLIKLMIKKTLPPSSPLKLLLSNTLNPHLLQSSCSGLWLHWAPRDLNRMYLPLCTCEAGHSWREHVYSVGVPSGKSSAMLWCCTSSKPVGSERQLRPTEIEANGSERDDCVVITYTCTLTHLIHAF